MSQGKLDETINGIDIAIDLLGRIAAIFKAIQNKCMDDVHLTKLANIGKYIATEKSNY